SVIKHIADKVSVMYLGKMMDLEIQIYACIRKNPGTLYHYSLQRLNQNDEYIRLSVPRHPELKKQILSYAFEFFRGLNSFFPAVRNDFFAYGRVLLFLQVHLMI